MDVYIKGMEMPKCCFECNLSHPAYGMTIICGAIWKTIDAPDCEKQRLDNCPLVPVPPHGRLIDADALKQNTYEIYDPLGIIEAVPVDVIDNAPTIIPAAGGE